jgi:hypothetical protein
MRRAGDRRALPILRCSPSSCPSSMLKVKLSPLIALVLACSVWAEDSKLLYENNFEKAEVGKVPDDFLVLDGDFTVKQEGQ